MRKPNLIIGVMKLRKQMSIAFATYAYSGNMFLISGSICTFESALESTKTVLCFIQFQRYDLPRPPFMEKSIAELSIGTYDRIATVSSKLLLD